MLSRKNFVPKNLLKAQLTGSIMAAYRVFNSQYWNISVIVQRRNTFAYNTWSSSCYYVENFLISLIFLHISTEYRILKLIWTMFSKLEVTFQKFFGGQDAQTYFRNKIFKNYSRHLMSNVHRGKLSLRGYF